MKFRLPGRRQKSVTASNAVAAPPPSRAGPPPVPAPALGSGVMAAPAQTAQVQAGQQPAPMQPIQNQPQYQQPQQAVPPLPQPAQGQYLQGNGHSIPADPALAIPADPAQAYPAQVQPSQVYPPQAHPGQHPAGLQHPGQQPQSQQRVLRPRSPSESLHPTRPPAPPQNHRPKGKRARMHPFFRLVNGVLTLVLLAMVCVGVLALVVKSKFEEAGPLAQTSQINIPRGRGLTSIAALLERKGFVSDSRLFAANVYYKHVQSKLKAGRYEIPGGASINEVVDALVKGRAVSYKVTFPEGYTSLQIVNRLKATLHLEGDLPGVPPEGSLLPDTYTFSEGMSRAEIIDRMHADQKSYLAKQWQNRQQGLPLQSMEEALILASIVEKETGIAGERAHVAGVFINRLRKGIKLQSDPTIIYGLVGGKGKLGHGIKRSELKKRTAYNTYQIPALPPTPICNPGREAIAATLNPAVTDDLFFVADGSGGHVFAKTLKQHNKNVKNWRKVERERLQQRRAREKTAKKQAASRSSNGTSVTAVSAAVAATPPASAAPKVAALPKASALKVINSGRNQIPLPIRKPSGRR